MSVGFLRNYIMRRLVAHAVWSPKLAINPSTGNPGIPSLNAVQRRTHVSPFKTSSVAVRPTY